MDLGALWDKVVNGNKSADVIKGYDIVGATNKKNPTNGWMPWAVKEQSSAQTSNNTAPAQNQEVQAPQQSGGGSGVSSGPQRDLAAEAFYQSGLDQANGLLGSLGNRESTALQSLLGSYLKAKQRQDVSLADNSEDYKRDGDRLVRENAQRKSQIDTNVRNNITSLQRMLASRGAGSSSASQLMVPQAAASEGTAKRAEATQTFVENKDAVDTNFKRYKREWDQSRLDTDADYQNNQNDVKSQFAQQGIDTRQKIQELQTNLAAARGGDVNAINSAKALTAQINDLQAKIADYAKRVQSRVISANDPAYKPVATTAQANDMTGVQAGAEQDPAFDQTSAYYGDTKELSDEELLKQLYGA